MTEAVTTEEELKRRSTAFQIEPTQIKEFEYKEFPSNADPIIETIEQLYKKIETIDEEESYDF